MAKEKSSPTPPALTAHNGEKVLIVDDDPRVLDLLQITLTGRGFGVVTAVNGDEALRRVQSARPDLMVVDSHLPKRPGLEVMTEIRRLKGRERFPTILISSNTSSEARLEAFRQGVDDFVAKPFSPRELILRIRRILDRIEESRGLTRRVRELETMIARGERQLEDSRADMRSRLFRVGSMFRALQNVTSASNTDELAEQFVRIAVGYLELSVAGLFLSREGGDFECRIVRGWHGQEEALHFGATGLLAEQLRTTNRPLSLSSIGSMPEAASDVGRLRSAGIRYLVPVTVGGNVTGAIGVSAECRDPNVADLVTAVAQSVGVALQNQNTMNAMHASFLETSSLLIRNLESRHTGLEGHSDRVADTAVALARRLGLAPAAVDTVRLGAKLHDLGLVEIYEALETPTDQLPEAARRRVEEAPARAAVTIAETGPLQAVADVVRHHHEHWNGTGYPDGLAKESIPLGARIVAVANALDALTHERPHRPALTLPAALDLLESESGKAFDPTVVRLVRDLLEAGDVAVA